MKSFLRILQLILIAGTFSSCNQKPSYTIDGKINVDSGTIYFQKFRNKMFFITDSAKIENGTFSFSGSVDRPDMFGLTINRNESFHPYFIFLENSRIQVEIDTADTHFAKISGSASNDLFARYRPKENRFSIDSFIIANPASPVAAYTFYREFAPGLQPEEIERNIALFDPSIKDLKYFSELKDLIASKRQIEIGSQAIDFTSVTPEGKEVKLSDFAGNYVLLDFWASWCAPCRKENPNVVRAYNKFKAEGFNVLAVSLDHKREYWLKAIATDSLPYTQVSDLKYWDSAPGKIYGIRNIPANVLIDPSGKIVARNLRGEDLEKKLEEVFAKK
jgi:peroxiredoxin